MLNKFIFTITVTTLIMSKVFCISLPKELIPYLDISKDIGRNYEFLAPPQNDVVPIIIEHNGINISPGIKYHFPKTPWSLRLSLTKGLISNRDFLPTHINATCGFIFYKKMPYECEIAISWLEKLPPFRQSTYHWDNKKYAGAAGYIGFVKYEKSIILSIFCGLNGQYWQTNLPAGLKQQELFAGGNIILTKMFICPYFSFGLCQRFASSIKREQSFTGFISIGIKLLSYKKSNILSIVDKIIAPKYWDGMNVF